MIKGKSNVSLLMTYNPLCIKKIPFYPRKTQFFNLRQKGHTCNCGIKILHLPFITTPYVSIHIPRNQHPYCPIPDTTQYLQSGPNHQFSLFRRLHHLPDKLDSHHSIRNSLGFWYTKFSWKRCSIHVRWMVFCRGC